MSCIKFITVFVFIVLLMNCDSNGQYFVIMFNTADLPLFNKYVFVS